MSEECIADQPPVAPSTGVREGRRPVGPTRPVMAVAGPSLHLRVAAVSPGILPFGGSGSGRPLAPEVVLESFDVVDLGGRDLDQLDVRDRLETVDARDVHVRSLARPDVPGPDDPVVVLEVEPERPGQD